MSSPASSEQPTITSAYRSVGVTFESLVCESETFRETVRLAVSASRTSVSILLLGETGTGKNLLAQAVHNAGGRARGPFVSVNCSAIPDTLLEAELFGAEKGAYTSSVETRRGKFELAHGGTLFLDEIGDMSPIAQAKVLHAIEYREFKRVGGEESLHADVRIVAATNRPLQDLLNGNGFRADLFYRLNEFTIHVPPLRERREEILPLARRFAQECSERFGGKPKRFAADAEKRLLAYPWPGNIRELRSVIKRACVSAASENIQGADLALTSSLAPRAGQTQAGTNGEGDLSLSNIEQAHIEKVLAHTGWNKKEASRLLGISRPTLDRKIADYSLKKPAG